MPKEKRMSESIDGALLFILFLDRVAHPDSYRAAEIYNHPDLPFKAKYEKKNFNSYCQTAANRRKKWERNGTGLTKTFKELVKEARVEHKDLIVRLKNPDGDIDGDDE